MFREGEGEPVIMTMTYGERAANVLLGEEHERKKKRRKNERKKEMKRILVDRISWARAVASKVSKPLGV